MSILRSTKLRKAVFAMAVLAVVSTTSGVAFAHGDNSGYNNFRKYVSGRHDRGDRNDRGHHNDNNNGYGNNEEQQKAIRRLNKQVASANSDYTKDASKALYKVAKSVRRDASKLAVVSNLSGDYYSQIASAQTTFAAAADAAATTSTSNSDFNDAYDTAQTAYVAAVSAAQSQLVSGLDDAGIRSSQLDRNLSQAEGRLTRNLDRAQQSFTRKTREDENSRPGGYEGCKYKSSDRSYKPGQRV